MLAHIKINNIEYQEDSSSTILQVAKKHGIKIPTLCYLKREESNLEKYKQMFWKVLTQTNVCYIIRKFSELSK